MFIGPIQKYNVSVTVAPDKSVTHRAIMLASIAGGKSEIGNPLVCDETLRTVRCMRALGAEIAETDSGFAITGTDELKSASLNAGGSGTTARLLFGLLAGAKGVYEVDGNAFLRTKPIKRIIEPLEKMGAKITLSVGGKLPAKIVGKPLGSVSYDMPLPSGQVKSSVLLAGLNAKGITTVRESVPTRDHTERLLAAMGCKIWAESGRVSITSGRLNPIQMFIPGDISAAAYAFVLAAIKGEATVKNVGINQTRRGILNVLSACGATVEANNRRNEVEPYADVTVTCGGRLAPFSIGRDQIPTLIDEIPVLAVLGCFADGESEISGATELTVREDNRIGATVATLKAMGADIEQTDGGLKIRGGGRLEGGAKIDPRGDCRIAMAAAVAGALSENGVELVGTDCVTDYYPDFFNTVR